MKKHLLTLFLLSSHVAFSQNTGTVSGTVIDKQVNEAVAGATVSVKGTNVSTSTDNQGNFILRNLNAGKIVLEVSHVGYETRETAVEIGAIDATPIIISLNIDSRAGNEIVISATRRREKISNAPASIQVIGAKNLEQFAGSNITEMTSKIQGIEYTRGGVDDITVNARGFNSAFNYKVLQLVDGRNTMAALSGGLPLFNNGSTNKDDIERIEIVFGPQSALYGPNAHNALFNYITKDPRKYQGTSISTSAGSQSQFSTRFRHAFKINNKWAYKITGEYASGEDYEWYDSVYAGGPPNSPVPAFGPAVAIPEKINDFGFHRYRGEGHIYYSVTPQSDIIVSGGGSKFTRLQVTTTGHNQLKDVSYGFLQARYVRPRFFANIYNTWGNLGTSLLVGSYTSDYWNRTHSTSTTGSNRYLPPDSAELFATQANTLKEKSQRLNAELQYNYLFKEAGMSLVTGITYQLDRPNGYGITLIDSFERITVNQYGAVVQLDKTLPWQLRLVATARYDHHSNYGDYFAPKLALLKRISDGNVRLTWGKAYAMPTIQNQYAGIRRFIFGNGAGVYYIPNGTNVENTASYLTTTPLLPEQISTWEIGYKGNLAKKLYVDINYYNGLSKNFLSPAITQNGRVLTVNGISVTHNPGRAGTIVNDTLRQASFQTFFNYGDVRAYGVDAGITYTFNKIISLAIRYSWFGSDITKDNLKNDANNDGYVSSEEKSLNASRNRAVGILSFQNLCNAKLFVNLSVRYVEQYEFYSGLQIGTIDGKGKRGMVKIPGSLISKNFDWGPLGGFTTIDIEAGYRFNEMIAVNTGITNLFNTNQIEMVGSPSIGRLIMVELKLNVPNRIN